MGLTRYCRGDYHALTECKPICWAAPETFEKVYSSASDVWSFGG